MEQLLYTSVDSHTKIRSHIYMDDDGRATVVNKISQRDNQVIADQCKREREFHARLSPRERSKARQLGFITGHVPILLWGQWRREWDVKFRSYMTWQEFEINKLNSAEFAEYRCTHEKIPMPVSAKSQAQNQIDTPMLGSQAETRTRRLWAVKQRHASDSAVVAA